MRMNEKILQCRKRMGLSQEELAQRLNTSRQAISKWELGTSQPEIQNVVALAKLFGVTTDWLLMDDEEDQPEQEQPEREAQPEASYQAPPQQERPVYGGSDSWVEHVPGVIGRLLKRYGWLAGVYIALSGAGMTLIGAMAKGISDSMVGYSQRAFDSLGGFGIGSVPGSMTIYDASGAVVTDPAIYEAFGMSGAPAGVNVSMSLPNPVGAVGSVVMVLGVVTMIAGAVIAWKLHQKSEKV